MASSPDILDIVSGFPNLKKKLIITGSFTVPIIDKFLFDILKGIQAMDEADIDVLENGFLLLSPKDHTNLIRNSKVINNPSFKTADVVSNGRVGQIAGLTIIKTTSVTADEAMIVVGQRAATWKSAQPITTRVIDDPGIKSSIRVWAEGHVQVVLANAIYVIDNTQV